MTTDVEAASSVAAYTRRQLEALSIVDLRGLARRLEVKLSRAQYSRKAAAVEAIEAAQLERQPRAKAKRDTNYKRHTCVCQPPNVIRCSARVEDVGVRCDGCGNYFRARG